MIVALRLGRPFGVAAISVGIIIGVWYSAIAAFHLDPYFAKTPVDVFHYAFSGSQAAGDRAVLGHSLLTTLRDAFAGYLVGTATALAVSVAFVLSKTVERSFLPLAVGLRSIPLVAMTPLITLLFGNGLAAVTAIGAIVTFFPTLVYLVHGMRSSPSSALDLVHAYGGDRLDTLRRIQLPTAIPALFAAARVAAPASLVGALLAEWLATGQGLGSLMVTSMASSSYDQLWAAVVLTTIASALFYIAVSSVEKRVLLRYGDRR